MTFLAGLLLGLTWRRFLRPHRPEPSPSLPSAGVAISPSDALAFVNGVRDYYGQYHAAKEVQAYGVALLHLTAVAYLFTTEFWRSYNVPSLMVFGVLTLSYAASALFFVAWQMERRRFAARMVAACITVATTWLKAPPMAAALAPTVLDGEQWPSALVTEFRATSSMTGVAPTVITLAVMLIATAAGVARVIGTCGQQ